jgi:hypothetical protein
MWFQRSFLDTDSAISSRALEPSRMPSDVPDGMTPAESGPALALAALSARQAGERGLLTSGTYGRPGSISSASAGLQSSLASRLRPLTRSLGSTLFTMTWRRWDTPSGRSYYLLRASVRPTDDTGYGSWPSPTVSDVTGGPRIPDAKRGSTPGLLFTVGLAHWPTPAVTNADRGGDARRWKGDQSLGGRRSNLQDCAMTCLASWATPASLDWRDGRASPETMDRNSRPLNEQAVQLAVSGPTPNGSPAGTERPGQLDPEHSRWLMGLPPEWCDCAVTAMASSPKRRKR